MSFILKKGTVAKTLFWSIIASIAGYVINFFVTPYITNKMGMEAYGFVSLTKTFVDYGALITTALNSYAVRYIGVEYHNNNFKKANEYYNSVLFADIFLSVFISLFAVGFSFTIQSTLKVPVELLSDVRKLFVLCFLNFAINTVMAVFSSAAYIKNKLDLNYFFRTIGYSAEVITLLLLFGAFDTKLFYIGVSYVIDSIIILCSRIWMTSQLTPELKMNYALCRITAVKELVLNGIWNSINSLGNILNTGLDILITNLMLTSTDLGIIGVVKTFPNMFVLLYQLIAQAFQPSMLRSYSIGDKDKLKQIIQSAMKYSGLITIIIYAGFFSVGRQFYELWLPGQNADLLYKLTLLALLPNAMEGLIYPCYYVYTLCVKNKIPCIITIIGGILNVLGMVVLIKFTRLGVYAILVTTVVVMGIIAFITNPVYIAVCLKVDKHFFYRIIARYVFIGGIICGVMKLLGNILYIKGWISLIIACCIIAILSAIIYFVFMFDKTEHEYLLHKFKIKI